MGKKQFFSSLDQQFTTVSSRDVIEQHEVTSIEMMLIDAGIEHIHVRTYGSLSDTASEYLHDIVMPANESFSSLFEKYRLLEVISNLNSSNKPLLLTGRLAASLQKTLNAGTHISSAATIWMMAKKLLLNHENRSIRSLGIIDLSAAGYTLVAVDKNGALLDDTLVVNPRCGAGSGINLKRILEKIGIDQSAVDLLLSSFRGDAGKEKRNAIPVRADRCGVFSSSATISDKNQGIPIDHALAVTMKSEVLKACKKMVPGTQVVYLTGRVFMWEYARNCASDFLSAQGTQIIVFDQDQSVYLQGLRHLSLDDKTAIRSQDQKPLQKPEYYQELPSFSHLHDTYKKNGLLKRIHAQQLISLSTETFKDVPINAGLDIGSTMAKIVLTDARTGMIIYKNSYSNRGDTIETIRHIFQDLKKAHMAKIRLHYFGITGSGRHQAQKVLQALYPHMNNNIFTQVENYAHAHGSLHYVYEYIDLLKETGNTINNSMCVLIDIGGEDTKVSTISLQKQELFDNVMNIKCSAGTGSLMDTLQSLFSITTIEETCKRAFDAPKAYSINATCAVFLMENARKLQAIGISRNEILASCNHAIVENMARTLWNQIDFPDNAVVLLHGQTMLSDPLPLAVTYRLNDFLSTPAYCLIPPDPGHRACIGLTRNLPKPDANHDIDYCNLNVLLSADFTRSVLTCHGSLCGDPQTRCTRIKLSYKHPERDPLSVVMGGCAQINEIRTSQHDKKQKTSSYKDLWEFKSGGLQTSHDANKLIIPRSFSISEYAYFFGQMLSHLGLPVHIDNVQERDILAAQPGFGIDTCAPLLGATGQFSRLASEEHGIIAVPQIDFLPTENCSTGKTCTTNQGGCLIGINHAQKLFPESQFHLFDISFTSLEPRTIALQLNVKLQYLFDFYNINPSFSELCNAVDKALKDDKEFNKRLADKAADFIQEAIKNKAPVSIVCGREYILNPGIFDSHAGTLLRDKGIVAIPSYVFDTTLSEQFSYLYWKNPHDIVSKIDAIARKQFHSLIKHPRLKELIRQIETGATDSTLSSVQISTFRCGPDSVTTAGISELTKQAPNLTIQSDATIKELAHLENRINTHVHQLENKLHDSLGIDKETPFKIEFIEDFSFDSIDFDKDVVYFPTLNDNRAPVAVAKAAGLTVLQNFDDATYDLEEKVKLGRKYTGDAVCLPLAAVFADAVLATEDFIARKQSKDPLVEGKRKLLIFNNKGAGPCRQGQYYETHKLLMYKKYGCSSQNSLHPVLQDTPVRFLVGDEKNHYLFGGSEWAIVQAFHAFFAKAVLHQLYLNGISNCTDREQYDSFYNDYISLKHSVFRLFEFKTEPSKWVSTFVEKLNKINPALGGIGRYFGYGLYRNNGLRKLFRTFGKKWNLSAHNDSSKIKIHIDGEAYFRVAQLDEIARTLIDLAGFANISMTYTPIWCYFEYLIELKTLISQEKITNLNEQLNTADSKTDIGPLETQLKKTKREIKINTLLGKILRSVLAKPLYKSAGLKIPHNMHTVLKQAQTIIPTLKPYGELAQYVGEALLQVQSGTDLIVNAAPEGCMVSSMGELFTKQILEKAQKDTSRIQHLFSLNGEIDKDTLELALIKTMGPERFYCI